MGRFKRAAWASRLPRTGFQAPARGDRGHNGDRHGLVVGRRRGRHRDLARRAARWGKHTGAAIRDPTDEMPTTIDDSDVDPLIKEVQERVQHLPWVADRRLRLREEGRFLAGTVYVVPRDAPVPPAWLEQAERGLLSLCWRLHDVSIVLRTSIELPPTGRVEEAPFPSPPRAGAFGTGSRRRSC
jgi:hypothetical protein